MRQIILNGFLGAVIGYTLGTLGLSYSDWEFWAVMGSLCAVIVNF